MDETVLDLLRCPLTGARLRWSGEGTLVSEDGSHRYKFAEGVFHLLSPLGSDGAEQPTLRDEKKSTQSYYDANGWRAEEGIYGDTKTFTDLRSAPWSYTSRCINRVRNHIPSAGRYLLDAASGAIPYPEHMSFHEGFGRRVCVDLSITALKEAKRKLGDRGIYILGDLTHLPLADDSIDAAISFHTIYHIPSDEQDKAFLEINRVLRPRGKAAIIYSWGYSPLTSRLLRFLDKLAVPAMSSAADGLYYHPHEKEWFFDREWPFTYEVRVWRTIGSSALQRMGDGRIFRWSYRILYELESMFPFFLGRHGQYPLIVLTKG